jgi:uncharacterized RDD family membrane protein YckC
MKCPKCHYLSFDPEPRCRNCGYDLELAEDLDLRTEEGQLEGPLVDLSLRDREKPKRAPISLELVRSAPAAVAVQDAVADGSAGVASAVEEAAPRARDREHASAPPAASPVGAPAAAVAAAESPDPVPAVAVASRREPRPPSTTSELPLFVKGLPQDPPALAARSDSVVPFAPVAATDEPLVRVPQAPRPPLAVRRSSSDPPQARARVPARKVGPLDRDLLEDLQRLEREESQPPAEWQSLRPSSTEAAPASEGEATLSTRFAAASIDGVLLAAIAVGVTYATLRMCDLDWHQLAVLPLLPLGMFLLVIVLGYLLMFTIAGGQTIGKMLFNIRVVPASSEAPGLSLTQAAYRELLSLPLVLAAGIGYLPALLGRGPALHDRLADTRVVRG